MISFYFVSNYLIYSEFIQIYTNINSLNLFENTLTAELPHTSARTPGRTHTAAHTAAAHCRTAGHSRALCRTLMPLHAFECRTAAYYLLHTAHSRARNQHK
jgi:23S rRNA G2445 N2-methylase RlmL